MPVFAELFADILSSSIYLIKDKHLQRWVDNIHGAVMRGVWCSFSPLFFVYYKFMEKFSLINKDRSRIKVFEPFEDVSKPSPSIDAVMISYGCVYKRSSKPVMKGSRVESVEAARKEYAELLKDGWKKTSIFKSYF